MHQNEVTQASSEKYIQNSLFLISHNFFDIQSKVTKCSGNSFHKVLSPIALIVCGKKASFPLSEKTELWKWCIDKGNTARCIKATKYSKMWNYNTINVTGGRNTTWVPIDILPLCNSTKSTQRKYLKIIMQCKIYRNFNLII